MYDYIHVPMCNWIRIVMLPLCWPFGGTFEASLIASVKGIEMSNKPGPMRTWAQSKHESHLSIHKGKKTPLNCEPSGKGLKLHRGIYLSIWDIFMCVLDFAVVTK